MPFQKKKKQTTTTNELFMVKYFGLNSLVNGSEINECIPVSDISVYPYVLL